MLDVHLPDHRIGALRDFLVHILTITVGLLIALALEGSAEALHHRHQRKEAEENIRAEIRSNLDKAKKAAPLLIEERANIAALLKRCQARAQNQPVTEEKIAISFSEGAPQDAAWRTALANGVLTYMDYSETEKFADVYKEQDLLQSTEEKALEDFLELTPLFSERERRALTPEEARECLPYVRQTLAHLDGILAVGAGTIGAYEEALN